MTRRLLLECPVCGTRGIKFLGNAASEEGIIHFTCSCQNPDCALPSRWRAEYLKVTQRSVIRGLTAVPAFHIRTRHTAVMGITCMCGGHAIITKTEPLPANCYRLYISCHNPCCLSRFTALVYPQPGQIPAKRAEELVSFLSSQPRNEVKKAVAYLFGQEEICFDRHPAPSPLPRHTDRNRHRGG